MKIAILTFLIISAGLFIFLFLFGKNTAENTPLLEKENKIRTQEIVDIKYIGKIDLNNLKDYELFDTKTILNGTETWINLEMWREAKLSKVTIQPTISFLESLPEFEKKAQEYLRSDFENGNTVKQYINDHIKMFSDDELQSLNINSADNEELKIIKFFDKIHIKSITIYPDDLENIAVFDYTINKELTQYLIAVNFDGNGKILDISVES